MAAGIPFWQKKVKGGITRPIFAKFKKHKCAVCGSILKLVKITHYQIEKGSPEAKGKYFRFDMFGHPVDYVFSIFECAECGNKLSISDQYFIENPHKKRPLRYDDYHQYLQSLDRQKGTNQYVEHVNNLEIQKKNQKNK